MRILALLCVLGLGAAAQQPLPPVPAPVSPNTGAEAQSNQQKARAVLDQMIQALGGQAYLTLHDSFTEGRYGRFHNEVMVGGTVYFRYWQWPDKERIELTKERDIADLYIGDTVTEITFRGGQVLDPKKDDNVRLALQRRHYSLEQIVREWINQPDVLLIDEGETLAEGKMTERITIINSRNQAVSLMIAPDTHLPVAKVFTTRDPQTRDRDEEYEIFDNWRVVQGISTPYSIVIKRNGEVVRQQYVMSVTYNDRPPDAYFTPMLINHEKK